VRSITVRITDAAFIFVLFDEEVYISEAPGSEVGSTEAVTMDRKEGNYEPPANCLLIADRQDLRSIDLEVLRNAVVFRPRIFVFSQVDRIARGPRLELNQVTRRI